MMKAVQTYAVDGEGRGKNHCVCDMCISRLSSMCSVLKPNELHKLNEITDHISIDAKNIVCEEGDNAEFLYNIVDGCVRISKMLADGRRQIIGFLVPGDFFGLSSSNGYGYSAETITDVQLCRMPREKLFKKFAEFPALGNKVLDMTKIELHGAQNHMLLLGRKMAKEKLCSFILTMSEKTGQIDNMPEDQVYLPMSRSDIADYLGLTIETVSRQFTILVKDKLIALEDNIHVRILEKERLRQISSGE
ncbi:cyclic nucleotide-binding domain-containing protein [Pseudemcibacter aquimaris]|uniref:cyclic nucleotide-binding domain-containing protein n=1 Tax=Pseudemcibacter aquimaris TaxID=2857064 RepID=UPI002011D5DE|nr:cyclic nucleotide-binding domain-containing protein [Pseudemcibacter aquimaris]MCC3861628.1 helix-turn-helix domain-containing protein [Pseudemcibacter aquimaris]WDU58398.1 helix-turn-helix domain-containing protein [Pseudemcibacter aquimaris]